MSRHQEDGFAHSMTDLMAGVAVTFLLLAAIFMVQANTLRREAERKRIEAEQQAKELREEPMAREELVSLRDALQALTAHTSQRARIEPDPRDPLLLLVIFESNDWFESAQCRPKQEHLPQITPLLADVFRTVCDERYQHIESIILEGHTDRRPFCPGRFGARADCGAIDSCEEGSRDEAGFKNNVRLSAARAQELFFIARKAIERTGTNKSVVTCLEQKFVVSGRGPVEPRHGGNWKEDQPAELDSHDRRVVLKVRFRQRPVVESAADAGASP